MTEPSHEASAPSTRGRGEIRFAHASEAEFARILDFYEVRWKYEPEVFPILWDLDGNVVESFTPDFYLPDFDMFVEMTTLQQRLVRKKNRKVRRLRELYPFVSIKLFYARDFRALMLKYGRVALIDELSGATGQASVETPRSVTAERSVTLAPAGGRTQHSTLPVRSETVPAPSGSPESSPGKSPEPSPAAGLPEPASTHPGRSRAARRRAARRAALALAQALESS